MFGWLFRNKQETRSSDSHMWNLSEVPFEGTPVTAHRAMSVGAVWQAMSLISGDLAKLPIDLYYRRPDGNREIAADHPATRIVKAQPNPQLTAMQFWRRMYFWALMWGQSFAYVERDAQRRIRGLLPIPNHSVDVVSPRAGEVYYLVTIDGEQMTFGAADIVHITWLEWEDSCAVVPLAHFREAVALALASEGYATEFYKSGAMAGGILELPATMTKKARDTVEEGFTKKYEGRENWFKTVILREGAKFHATSLTAQDSQTQALREDQVREIARFFNIPPSRMGLPDTVSYNSLEQSNRAYIQSTLEPWMRTAEQQLWLKCLGTDAQRTHYFEYNTNALLRADTKTRYEIYDIGIRIGLLSPADAAKLENLPYEAGRSDEYNNPQTQPGSPVGEPATDPPAEDPAEDPQEGEENERSAPQNAQTNGKLTPYTLR